MLQISIQPTDILIASQHFHVAMSICTLSHTDTLLNRSSTFVNVPHSQKRFLFLVQRFSTSAGDPLSTKNFDQKDIGGTSSAQI